MATGREEHKTVVRYSLMLLFASAIWGFAFVAQSKGGDACGPFSFTAVRCLLGSLVLIPVIKLLDRLGYGKKPANAAENKKLWVCGFVIGFVLLAVLQPMLESYNEI